MTQPRRTFDLVDGLLYAGIRLIFGDKTPPIEDVLIGKPVPAPDIRFDADRIHTPRPIRDVRHNWMVQPGSPPRLVPRRSHG